MNALQRVLARPPVGAVGFAVGYSGGMDSSALLHAFVECQRPRFLRAIHVCHHLQPEAPAWADHCARQCKAWGVAFIRADVRVDAGRHGMEAAARDARYAALAAELAPGEVLVTAHHAQDQAETFLLQALRGAGPKGLAAMPHVAPFGAGQHWRPWLDFDHQAITAYARDHALEWIEDPSNRNPDVDRAFLRAEIWPVLERRWPAAARTLARSAAHVATASTAVTTLAEQDLDAARTEDGGLGLESLDRLGVARQREVVRLWLARAGLDCPDHRHLGEIHALGPARLTASPCVRFAATEVRRFDDRLYAMRRLAPAPDRTLAWDGGTILALPADCGQLELMPLTRAPLVLRVGFRVGGERVVDVNGRHRALKDVLRERRVAPWLRSRIPLVYCGACLVAAGDVWHHPEIEHVLGLPGAVFRWRYPPVGAAVRVVAPRAFG